MKRRHSKVLLAVLALLPVGAVLAQSAPLVVVPGPGAEALQEAAAQTRPWRFAVEVPVQLSSMADGVWSEEGEEQIWRLQIQSPGATSLSLHFADWQLPEGARLWLHDANSGQTQGPYDARHNAGAELWTGMLLSDTVDVELRAPQAAQMPQIVIAGVAHGFRTTDGAQGVPLKSGNCNIDVACPEADPYADQVRSTVLLVIGGTAACTGTLINNRENDFYPYVLTADHCEIGTSNDQSVVSYFNFQRSACARGAQSSREDVQLDPQQSISGSEFVAGNPTSDFTLLVLGSASSPATVPASWEPYWSGWTRSEQAADSGASIHHPSADEKSIALFSSELQRVQLQDAGQSVETWEVVWSAGTTEQGSSGSGIFGTDGLLRGQLYGGGASCGTPSSPDYYGRFSVSWNRSAQAAEQLAAWLDPNGENPGAWGGLNFDGRYQSVDSTVEPTPVPTTPVVTPTPSPGGSSGSGAADGLLLLLLLTVWGRRAPGSRRE